MRQVGTCNPQLPSASPSAEALRAAAAHQKTGAALAALATTGIAKGVYRFASHAEMNRQTEEALARAMALNSRLRDAKTE
jgi:hypothetical protein